MSFCKQAFLITASFCLLGGNALCQRDDIKLLETDTTLKRFYGNIKVQVDVQEHSRSYQSQQNGQSKSFAYDDYDVFIYNDGKKIFRKLYRGQPGSAVIQIDSYGLAQFGQPQCGYIDLDEICNSLLKRIPEKELPNFASNASLREMGLSALKKISNEADLVLVARNSVNPEVGIAALERISDRDPLAGIAENCKTSGVGIKAAGKISDQDILIEIAKKCRVPDVGIHVLALIKGQDALTDVSINAGDGRVREAAVKLISVLFPAETGVFKDPRDGKVYRTAKFGTQWIMTENYAYRPASGHYWAYGNDSSNISKYGYLYDYETAGECAPPGWHLPSEYEWRTFLAYMGNDDHKIFYQLKNGGFKVLFGGMRFTNGTFHALGEEYVGFWSSTKGFSVSVGLYGPNISLNKDQSPDVGLYVRYFKDK